MNYWRKRRNAFAYALKGLRLFFLQEDHAKIHLLVAIGTVILAFVLNVNFVEWLGIIFSIALVITAETINSAIEKLTDLASPDFSEKAGAVKDMAAGAVLIASLAALTIGLMIFIPKIAALL